MTRRATLLLTLIAVAATLLPGGSASATDDHRPDGWIKLCGLSTGCTLHPLPHPWKGDDVYNTTGTGQSLDIKIEEGEGVRYWITVQNDGALGDSLLVQGCQGNKNFSVNRVALGQVKRPEAKAVKVTNQFLDGTLKFDLSSPGSKAVFTLNMIATTVKQGVSYRCPITVSSAADPSLHDTVSASMVTI
jgi:hypothetical protein